MKGSRNRSTNRQRRSIRKQYRKKVNAQGYPRNSKKVSVKKLSPVKTSQKQTKLGEEDPEIRKANT